MRGLVASHADNRPADWAGTSPPKQKKIVWISPIAVAQTLPITTLIIFLSPVQPPRGFEISTAVTVREFTFILDCV